MSLKSVSVTAGLQLVFSLLQNSSLSGSADLVTDTLGVALQTLLLRFKIYKINFNKLIFHYDIIEKFQEYQDHLLLFRPQILVF